MCKIDFIIFIIKPQFCRRYMTVSRLIWASFIVWLTMNISSKYIFTLMLIFIRGEIEIPNNFVKICGAEPSPKHRHTNSKIVPFHRNLRTSLSFDPMRHWSMDPSRQICRSNRPPVLITLNERGFPFWNGEKEQTGYTFLD